MTQQADRAQLIGAFAEGASRVREAWTAVPEGARHCRPAPRSQVVRRTIGLLRWATRARMPVWRLN
jgi:hypothetical protein